MRSTLENEVKPTIDLTDGEEALVLVEDYKLFRLLIEYNFSFI